MLNLAEVISYLFTIKIPIMKKLLLLTLFCGLLAVGTASLYRSDVEAYGLATVQVDEKTGTYFIEAGRRCELEPTEDIKAGKLVSYLKNKGVSLRISPKVLTREEMVKESKKDFQLGCVVGSIAVWSIGTLVLLLEFLFKNRRLFFNPESERYLF